MRWLLLAALTVSGCGSNPAAPTPVCQDVTVHKALVTCPTVFRCQILELVPPVLITITTCH